MVSRPAVFCCASGKLSLGPPQAHGRSHDLGAVVAAPALALLPNRCSAGWSMKACVSPQLGNGDAVMLCLLLPLGPCCRTLKGGAHNLCR